MPCAFHIEGSNFKCQFNFRESELIVANHKQWCPFHAPLEDASGKPTEKGEWTHHEINEFDKKILSLLTKTLNEQETLDLSGVIFPSEARFQGREFPDVNFSHALFMGHAYFWCTKFKGNVNFFSAKFKGQASFNNAKFMGESTFFLNSKFDENAYFEHVKFGGNDVSFNNVKFKKTVSFQHSIFSSESAKFREAEFNDLATFQKARFEGRADFRTPGNNSDVDAFHDVVNFEGVEFLDYAIFENRNFRKRTIFKNCTFHKAPHFHGCRFHQDTDFTDARFFDKQGDEAARAYRTLKLDMENKRARQEQLRFYALEMKSRRNTEKRKFLKFLSWLYEATSDYGQSIISPFASAFMVFVLSMIVYSIFFLAIPIADFEKTDIVILTSRFTLEQIIRPFRALENSPSISEIVKKAQPSNLWRLCLGITTTLQSLLSLVLLLLSALAARWRFKIG